MNNSTAVTVKKRFPFNSNVFFFFYVSLKPSLLKAIFNVDPDEVRSLIFKKEDVNVQVTHTFLASYLSEEFC